MCSNCDEPTLYRCEDGFVWEVINGLHNLKNAWTAEKELCVLYPDESETLIESWDQLQDAVNNDHLIVTPFVGVVHIKDIEVTDPDSGLPVDVSIYKDKISGAMFGIDSSFPDDRIHSPYEINDKLQIFLGDS